MKTCWVRHRATIPSWLASSNMARNGKACNLSAMVRALEKLPNFDFGQQSA